MVAALLRLDLTDRVNIMTLKWPNFQRPTVPYTPLVLIQSLKECRSPVYNASLGTLRGKNDRLLTPEPAL